MNKIKRMHGTIINSNGLCINNNNTSLEKTAEELFDDLGLWLERETPFDFEVKNDDDKVIKFNKERREIACFNYYDGFEYLTLQELQAINKKVRELRLAMMNKCKYITIRTKNYEKYFYCRLNKKTINYTTECIKCVKNEPRKNKGINKVSKNKIAVTQDTYNKVMQRDNYKCRLCGTSLNLQLHHIIYRSEDKSKINDINNCIMLCVKHHVLVHSNKKYWQPKLLELAEALQR